jgi:hypothetical protein
MVRLCIFTLVEAKQHLSLTLSLLFRCCSGAKPGDDTYAEGCLVKLTHSACNIELSRGGVSTTQLRPLPIMMAVRELHQYGRWQQIESFTYENDLSPPQLQPRQKAITILKSILHRCYTI